VVWANAGKDSSVRALQDIKDWFSHVSNEETLTEVSCLQKYSNLPHTSFNELKFADFRALQLPNNPSPADVRLCRSISGRLSQSYRKLDPAICSEDKSIDVSLVQLAKDPDPVISVVLWKYADSRELQ
jgi:type III secretory pathway lipoprotein EscJ